MKSKEGRLVLFIAPKKGTVIHEDNPYYGVAYHSETWAMLEFEDYNKSVLIQNI